MGFPEAEKRLRNTGIWALILIVGLIVFPGILVSIWFRIQSFATARVQFQPSNLQSIAIAVVILGVGGWILLGLLKEE